MKYRIPGLALVVLAMCVPGANAQTAAPSVSSSSNYHPVGPVGPSDPAYPTPPQVSGGGGDYYGANPLFRRIFGGRRSGNVVAAPVGGTYVQPAPLPNPGGTLVFPNHPFMRSPRDFFMIEVN